MKRLRTYEGIFSFKKDNEIPLSLINGIVNNLKSNGYTTKVSKSSNRFYTLLLDTKVGQMSISLSKSDSITKVRLIYNGRFLRDEEYHDRELKTPDYSRFSHYVANAVNQVEEEIEKKKKEDELFSKLSIDEVKDLLSDISDVNSKLAQYKIEKSPRGYIITFEYTFKGWILPGDAYLKMITEISILNKRLIEGYKAFCNYRMNKDNKLQIYICLERKKKE